MSGEFEVTGDAEDALFTLKVRRGEGMSLLSMDWKDGKPPDDFVGFAIERQAPDEDDFYVLENRLSFAAADGSVDPVRKPSKLSPIQKFRWVDFPPDAEVDGEFTYRVTPVFMDDEDELSYGDPQTAAIALGGETYPDKLNVTFTRGFVSSQAFVDRYKPNGSISNLIPDDGEKGLEFKPTHPDAKEALDWMGFEARRAIIAVLDEAIADEKAQVRVVAYELNEPELHSRLKQLGDRLMVIIDDSDKKDEPGSVETKAAEELAATAGAGNVKRQHMKNLQHNKTIVVDGPQVQAVVCGSTNFTWRGFFVQGNNALVLRGDEPVKTFLEGFDSYWDHSDAPGFAKTPSAKLTDLKLAGIDSRVAFSPHSEDNALLKTIADDIGGHSESSVLYSLAFLHQTGGSVTEAIKTITADDDVFVYGISDHEVHGIELQKPDGNVAPAFSWALTKNVPEPFKSEPIALVKDGEGRMRGTRMHHKFVVIDFDKPTARVYMGSYNFSGPADTENGENLLVIKDRRIATSYAIEALRIFDHYHFRVAVKEAEDADEPLVLAKPPRSSEEAPWWGPYYTEPAKKRDREIFA
jgi:phosphatidylserine/phosphatidylglycerophosphate/cardiolipin synthase-like enzyme